MIRQRCLVMAWMCLVLSPLSGWSDDPPNTQPDTDLPTPEASAAMWKAPEGFHVSAFAAEPDVKQPIGFCFDERGRLWVAENNTYAEQPTNFAAGLHDRIVVLQDTDGDGRADKRTVFWDKASKLTSVAVGFGGVWALCAPQLLFIPDLNQDDIPDSDPIVVLDGWDDFAVRHNIVNGLQWGPDGWLYGRHGILATSLVGAPGSLPSQRQAINCGVWRYHPTRKVFEVVARGTTNPWGMDYDEHGQMFFINTVIGHLWHIVPGAHYQRMYGVDFDPHLYDLMTQTADHVHWDTKETWSDVRKGVTASTSEKGGGHAHCGLLIYQGDNWPKEYQGGVFTINLHGLRLNHDVLEREGAGYVAHHAADHAGTTDRWFRGIDLISGPDGAVYIADWTDVGECHENDGVHRSSGRIYRLAYGADKPVQVPEFAKLPAADLVPLLTQGSMWNSRQARLQLQERAAAGQKLNDVAAALTKIVQQQVESVPRLRALWGVQAIGPVPESLLLPLLADQDEHVRSWSVRLLADGLQVTPTAIATLTRQVAQETSGLVQMYYASALQKMPVDSRFAIAEPLATQTGEPLDPNLELMVWYGIHEAVTPQAAKIVAACDRITSSRLRQNIARRLVVEIETYPAGVDLLVQHLAKGSPELQRDFLTGMALGLRGWRKAPQPVAWKSTADKLRSTGNTELRELVDELSLVFGDGRALTELLQIARNGSADAPQRQQALRILAQSRAPDLLPVLKQGLNDHVLREESIRGLAGYDDPQIPALILQQFPRLAPSSRAVALTTLTARPTSALALIEALQKGQVDRGEVTAYHVRQMRSFGNPELEERLKAVWGEIRDTPAEKRELMNRLKAELTATKTPADLSAGRAVFAKTCAACHTLFGEGGRRGPDLTGANRQNLDYLLENIIDPSATLATSFRVSAIELKDGRVVTGVVQTVTPKTMTVLTAQEELTLSKEDIEEVVQQNVSLMPDGLLTNLTPAEIHNLFSYLASPRQVPLAAAEPAAAAPVAGKQ